MFKKLIEKLQSLATERKSFDPSRFNDPIAMQTQWTPAKRGGTNFRTHKLVEVDINRLEFKASVGAKIYCSIFLFVGIAIMIIFFVVEIASGIFTLDPEMIFPLVMGLVFAVVGGGLFYYVTTPIVFDKYKGSFWRGRKGPDDVSDRRELKHYTELENIHALQLLSEYCSGNKSSYYSYELNLVLKDGSRINVIDHGNQKKLREDAQTLSGFLGKPLWDAT